MSATGIEIVCVRDEAAAAEVRRLAQAYKAWNYDFMPDMSAVIDDFFARHDFEGHLARLLIDCNPPDGECLLAKRGGEPVGIVTLQRRAEGEADLNRLFVTDAARGHGVGRALVTTAVARARALGYSAILLSTLKRFEAALALYKAVGFVEDGHDDDPDIDIQVGLRLDLT